MSNPYVKARTGEPISDNRHGFSLKGKTAKGTIAASAQPGIAANGELNAHNKMELIQALVQLLTASSEGEIQPQLDAVQAAEAKKELTAQLLAAYTDHSGSSNNFAIFGEEIANSVRDTAARAGFLRRFLRGATLQPGQHAQIRLHKHTVTAFEVGEYAQVIESRHDGKFMFPAERTFGSRPIINEGALFREGAGLLDEKSNEAIEAVMVVEDRGLKNLFDAAVAATGAEILFPVITPTVFSNLKQRVTNTGGVPVEDCWISNSLWSDIIGDNTWMAAFDPISKHELILTGRVGRLMDTNLHTDSFLESRLRVLSAGEIYFPGRSDFLGEVQERMAVTSSEISGANDGEAWRGWFIREILAIGVANANAVSKGRKI